MRSPCYTTFLKHIFISSCILLSFVNLEAQCLEEVLVRIYYSNSPLPVFDGVYTAGVQIDTVYSLIESADEGRTKWVKKRADNCLSQNPADCLVWCLVEGASNTDTIRVEVVADTTSTSAYHYESFDWVLSNHNTIEEREVVCEEDMDKKFLRKLRRSLKERGFDAPNDSTYGVRYSAVVREFQMEYEFPLGGITKEMLAYLEVDWPY